MDRMSFKLIFPHLSWSEFLHVLSFLKLEELFNCGITCKSAYVHILLREKNIRHPLTKYTHSQFLPTGYRQERILLLSYPRCGNSLLRQLIENETGIVTGSDSRSNRTLAASLIRCGFKGEGVVDSSVWVVKSHFPERMGYVKCAGDRVIILVRNPFDSIESYFHLGMTNSHDKSLTDEAFISLNSLWDECVTNEARVWRDFYHFWLTAVDPHVPSLIVRYEDLATKPQETMRKVMSFLLSGKPPLQCLNFRKNMKAAGVAKFLLEENELHTYINNRTSNRVNKRFCGQSTNNISVTSFPSAGVGKSPKPTQCVSSYVSVSHNHCTPPINSAIGYNPKKGGIGKGLRRMTDAHVDCIVSIAGDYMRIFGYTLDSYNEKALTPALHNKSALDGKNEYFLNVSESFSSDDISIQARNFSLTTKSVLAESVSRKSSNDVRKSVWINTTFSIRKDDDRFGRLITFTRKELTANDSSPFPTD